jgi:hypothetical protein
MLILSRDTTRSTERCQTAHTSILIIREFIHTGQSLETPVSVYKKQTEVMFRVMNFDFFCVHMGGEIAKPVVWLRWEA